MDPARAAWRPAGSGAASRHSQLAGDGLLGRDPELAWMRRLLTGAADLGAVILEGEAGIGKSALLAAGIAAARDEGWTVLVARGIRLRRDCRTPA